MDLSQPYFGDEEPIFESQTSRAAADADVSAATTSSDQPGDHEV